MTYVLLPQFFHLRMGSWRKEAQLSVTPLLKDSPAPMFSSRPKWPRNLKWPFYTSHTSMNPPFSWKKSRFYSIQSSSAFRGVLKSSDVTRERRADMWQQEDRGVWGHFWHLISFGKPTHLWCNRSIETCFLCCFHKEQVTAFLFRLTISHVLLIVFFRRMVFVNSGFDWDCCTKLIIQSIPSHLHRRIAKHIVSCRDLESNHMYADMPRLQVYEY